jgi:hypothetical protein
MTRRDGILENWQKGSWEVTFYKSKLFSPLVKTTKQTKDGQ